MRQVNQFHGLPVSLVFPSSVFVKFLMGNESKAVYDYRHLEAEIPPRNINFKNYENT